MHFYCIQTQMLQNVIVELVDKCENICFIQSHNKQQPTEESPEWFVYNHPVLFLPDQSAG